MLYCHVSQFLSWLEGFWKSWDQSWTRLVMVHDCYPDVFSWCDHLMRFWCLNFWPGWPHWPRGLHMIHHFPLTDQQKGKRARKRSCLGFVHKHLTMFVHKFIFVPLLDRVLLECLDPFKTWPWIRHIYHIASSPPRPFLWILIWLILDFTWTSTLFVSVFDCSPSPCWCFISVFWESELMQNCSDVDVKTSATLDFEGMKSFYDAWNQFAQFVVI